MAQTNPDLETTSPLARRDRLAYRADVAALIVLGLIVALAVRGHFVKPHTDFFQFRETGHSLLAGELPDSFKRAPLYPALVATLGALLATLGTLGGALLPLEVPDQTAAEWLNALLLPLNAVLMYLIGRRWFGSNARWLAAWVVFVPWGVYCTAHVIAEPLLIATILLTVLAAQRGSWLAYPAACLASIARYDAAALLLGLALADLLRGRRFGRVALSAGLAILPLAVWMGLTAATWQTRSHDHYLAQMAERPEFDLLWSLGVPLDVLFSPDRIRLPGWLPDWDAALKFGVRGGLVALAVLGCVVQVRRKDRAAITALVGYVGYTLVHAAFPFREFRFGYPLAPLLLLGAGIGVQWLRDRLSVLSVYERLRSVVLGLATFLVACVVIGEAGALPLLPGMHTGWGTSLTLMAVGGLILLWAAPHVLDRRGLARLVVLFAMIALVSMQSRTTAERLGTGREMINMVQAARWVRDSTTPDERVVATTPGLLRLFAGDEPRDRFLAYHQIEGDTWAEILAECRGKGITHLVWHDQLFAEHGGYYAGKWRLERFEVLSESRELAGIEVVREFRGHPNLWILRVLPE